MKAVFLRERCLGVGMFGIFHDFGKGPLPIYEMVCAWAGGREKGRGRLRVTTSIRTPSHGNSVCIHGNGRMNDTVGMSSKEKCVCPQRNLQVTSRSLYETPAGEKGGGEREGTNVRGKVMFSDSESSWRLEA